jgi:homospermidine synthase
MVASDHRILLLGCGAVQQNLLLIINRILTFINFNSLFIIDKDDKSNIPSVSQAIQNGATFIQLKITRDNYIRILNDILSSGDLVIDLSVGISGYHIVEWCLKNNVYYINTACIIFCFCYNHSGTLGGL